MGGHFPDKQHTLLLKSALSYRLEAIRYFVDWLEVKRLDKLDPASESFLSDFMDSIDLASQRLLPLVIHNLGDDTHPYFKFLVGTRKNYWVKNKQIEYRAEQVQQVLAQNDIPFMIIKGLNLATGFYDNPGLRPMHRGDILIPYAKKDIAFTLAGKGLFGNKITTNSLKPRNMAQTVHLEFLGDVKIDIHWSIFREYAHLSEASDFIWQGSTKEKRSGGVHFTMSATHALFTSLVQGSRFEPVPPIGWVADAKMIAGKSEIDWHEMLELVKQFHYKPFFKRAFPYLTEQYQFELPEGFLERLSSIEVSPAEEYYYQAISANNTKYGLPGLFWNDAIRRIRFHKLFFRSNTISAFNYLFHVYFNRIKAAFSS